MLGGESEQGLFKCRDSVGNDVSPMIAILPIIRQHRETYTFEMIGTGFFLSRRSGVLMTAKHVLEDVVDSNGEQQHAIGIAHFYEKHKCIFRNLTNRVTFTNSDVGIATVAGVKHPQKEEPLSNAVLTIAQDTPSVAQAVHTYSYANNSFLRCGNTQELHFHPRYYEGVLSEFFPNGRDSSMLPNPCWRSSLYIHGGSSGAPVFNAHGHVVGICSSSLASDPSCSFISSIAHISGLNIKTVIACDKDSRGITTLGDIL